MSEIVYGYLIVLGTNGRKSWRYSDNKKETNKLKVVQRPQPNGIKQIKMDRFKEAKSSQAVQSKYRHTVSYTLSQDEAIIIEYGSDPKTDMYQIGRCTENQNDFVVNSVPTDKTNINLKSVGPETVSRFACRINIDRSPPHTARIYAAGFDGNKNIFLGENAIKWEADKELIDGFTTNGVMICHPPVSFTPEFRSNDAISKIRECQFSFANSSWREVSVSGSVYSCLSKRGVPQSKSKLNEDNILRDGTLIDLCGVTLIWRSNYTDSELEDDILFLCCKLNERHIQCPIGYQTLRISPDISAWQIEHGKKLFWPGGGADSKQHHNHGQQQQQQQKQLNNSNHQQQSSNKESNPYVYLKCGHVHGFHEWKTVDDNNQCRTCPLCKQRSPFVILVMGQETGFFLDLELPTYCFNPCGHMGSEATVKYWYNIALPNCKNSELSPRCPFCYVECTDRPVRLIFS